MRTLDARTLRGGPGEAFQYDSMDTVGLARSLLGKRLVRVLGGKRISMPITEVEAYHGESDLACHASKGRTPRTEVLYGEPGHWYVYLVYGLHLMLNVVTGPAGHPAAILIRGAGEIVGPGRLSRHLKIGHDLNGKPVDLKSGLFIEDGSNVPEGQIVATGRIGVEYAGPVWANMPWRFVHRPDVPDHSRGLS